MLLTKNGNRVTNAKLTHIEQHHIQTGSHNNNTQSYSRFFRICVCAGAVLLDLDQKTLPGIAHQVVEKMIISDQIKAEDRANVLRALLLKHR